MCNRRYSELTIWADAGGKQWFYTAFNTKSEARLPFAASISWKWSIKNNVYKVHYKVWFVNSWIGDLLQSKMWSIPFIIVMTFNLTWVVVLKKKEKKGPGILVFILYFVCFSLNTIMIKWFIFFSCTKLLLYA